MKSINDQFAKQQRQCEAECQQWLAKREERALKDKKIILWMARLASIPLSLLALGNAGHIALSLASGKIKEISKYGSKQIFLEQQAFEFWASVFYHCTLTFFLLGATFICLRATGWFKNND